MIVGIKAFPFQAFKLIVLCYLLSSDALDEKGRLQLCCEDFKAHLNNLNDNVKNREVADHIESAIQSVQNTVRYERLNGDGPRHPRVTRTCPLVTR